MKRTATPLRPPRTEAVTPPDDEGSRVVARPDGFYWVADGGHQEFGPFPTSMEALLALRAGHETGFEPGETLEEAEAEIGFVDPAREDDGAPRE